MKIYVATDMEGISGIWSFQQCARDANDLYRRSQEYQMGDIAAVVGGLRAGGADEILVLDSHGGGGNFVPHLMAEGARYVTGIRDNPLWGLDDSCDGLAMIGYHPMWGTPQGLLAHTQVSQSEMRYWYNGVESGELAQHAAVAGHYGVPPIMVSGDQATCREARRFFGKSIVTVAVKEGLSREGAVLYPFGETRKALYEGAKAAVAAVVRCKPYRLRMPVRVKRQYVSTRQNPRETKVVTEEAKVNDIHRIISL